MSKLSRNFIAALPMYDWPERRAEVDAEWAEMRDAMRAHGIDAPARLARRNTDLPPVPGGIRDEAGAIIAPDPATLPPDGFDLATLWRHPDLLLAQTCWGPMEATGLAAHVRVVGQPDYSAFEGGEGESYRSVLVIRMGPPSGLPATGGGRKGGAAGPRDPLSPLEGEMAGRPEGGEEPHNLEALRNLRFAFNDRHSMSGYLGLARDLVAAGALENEAAFPAFWASMAETGGHRASIAAVAAGEADVAAIDCRSWAYARRYEPAAWALVVVGWTRARPGLPFITARRSPLQRL